MRVELLGSLAFSKMTWQPTSCSFDWQMQPYNAIHFNADVDWLLFICAPTLAFGLYYNKQLEEADIKQLVGPRGKFAHFVHKHLLPEFVRAMRATFRDTSLPVVVCSPLGKVTQASNWIVDELQRSVQTAFGVRIILGAAATPARELNALADLQVLTAAQSAVLWQGSTYSALAAVRLLVRNASVGWVADMRDKRLCVRPGADPNLELVGPAGLPQIVRRFTAGYAVLGGNVGYKPPVLGASVNRIDRLASVLDQQHGRR